MWITEPMGQSALDRAQLCVLPEVCFSELSLRAQALLGGKSWTECHWVALVGSAATSETEMSLSSQHLSKKPFCFFLNSADTCRHLGDPLEQHRLTSVWWREWSRVFTNWKTHVRLGTGSEEAFFYFYGTRIKYWNKLQLESMELFQIWGGITYLNCRFRHFHK